MSDETIRDTVLIVDDDCDFRELLSMIGQLCGVRVLQAGDCRQALEVLEGEHARIKLIFLDYFVPGTEPEVCAKMITGKAGPEVPVILVTAAADPARRASQLHIPRWLSKPLDVSVLSGLLMESSA